MEEKWRHTSTEHADCDKVKHELREKHRHFEDEFYAIEHKFKIKEHDYADLHHNYIEL
jgi:hypothetical protein